LSVTIFRDSSRCVFNNLLKNRFALLADEPTGNLDQQTAAQMLELMLDLNQQFDTALVVVTHDLAIAQRMQHRWRMQDGLLAPEA